ncbi:MAG: hypothetical protein ABIQ72_02350 [Usitatibacter sp.]
MNASAQRHFSIATRQAARASPDLARASRLSRKLATGESKGGSVEAERASPSLVCARFPWGAGSPLSPSISLRATDCAGEGDLTDEEAPGPEFSVEPVANHSPKPIMATAKKMATTFFIAARYFPNL